MNLSDKRRNTLFWALQLFGWGFINSVSFLVLKKFSAEFVTYSVVTGIFIGIFSTSLLRWYLKKNVFFDTFGVKELIKISGAFLITSALFAFLNFVFGYLYIEFGPELTELERNVLEVYDNVWILIVNSLFLIGVWTVCYLIVKLLLKMNANRIERLELNTNLKQAQLNTLKGQINPHFMFNSLNNIRGLMLEDVEKSREMLTKLSEMLRYSLTKNDVNAIAVEEEVEMVDNYIALSKIQFEDRLEFVKNIESDTLSLQIPPMIIQLLVENAAKHGISNLKQGGKIELEIKKAHNQLLIRVKNTGRLQISKNSTELGLSNIKQRLKLLYGEKAAFTIYEEKEEVVADIKIPLP
ncbi:sensor histidine kinase [Flagellimonas lutaonensis]|uniref:Putative signal transduction histidine kinase n=1 Tax=Flagellimonas lutaonensis TaxID=516051 RepID=A0A0D5YRE9_9FLAO|nr:histidine kinase [Allomuricauda lutaonensis]AKA34458.1 Putative signal transduction histidine kinase [Allomuricauda lutaonensis]